MIFNYEIGIECEENASTEILNTASAVGKMPASVAKNPLGHYLIIWKDTLSLGEQMSECLEKLDRMTRAGLADYGYVYVRIGKEFSDITVKKNTDNLTVPLIRKIYADGFEPELLEEKTEGLDL